MAQLLIEVPNEYLPGIEAARNIANSTGSNFSTIAEFASYTAIEAAKSWCIQYKVGPYWEQPQPKFNPDGTPFVPSEEPTINSNSEELVIPDLLSYERPSPNT